MNKSLSTEVKEFLAGYPVDVQHIVLALRDVVRSVAPNVSEAVDAPARMLAYSFGSGYKDLLCVIMPLKAGVNFGLPTGAMLPDPAKLLSGTGKRARHVRIDWETARSPALRALLERQLLLTKADS